MYAGKVSPSNVRSSNRILNANHWASGSQCSDSWKKFEMCKTLTFWSQLSQCNLDGMDLLQPKLSQAYKDDITVIKDRQDKRGHCGSNRQVSLKHPCLWTVWSVSYEPLICACGAPHPADRCHEPFYILGPGFEPPTFVVVSLAQVFVRLRNEFSDCW